MMMMRRMILIPSAGGHVAPDGQVVCAGRERDGQRQLLNDRR
jgi:hypothetical protein